MQPKQLDQWHTHSKQQVLATYCELFILVTSLLSVIQVIRDPYVPKSNTYISVFLLSDLSAAISTLSQLPHMVGMPPSPWLPCHARLTVSPLIGCVPLFLNCWYIWLDLFFLDSGLLKNVLSQLVHKICWDLLLLLLKITIANRQRSVRWQAENNPHSTSRQPVCSPSFPACLPDHTSQERFTGGKETTCYSEDPAHIIVGILLNNNWTQNR